MASKGSGEVYRVKSPFGVPGPDGFLRTYSVGALVAGDDPIVGTHRAEYLEPASDAVEQATAAPGERRTLRLPSAVRQAQALKHHTGSAHLTGAATMPHTLPPEHEDSPASTFAPAQPAAGVVADDVEEKGQNLAGGPTAKAAGEEYKDQAKELAEKHEKEPGLPVEPVTGQASVKGSHPELADDAGETPAETAAKKTAAAKK